MLDAPELVLAGVKVRRGWLGTVNADWRHHSGILGDETERDIANGALRGLDGLNHGAGGILSQCVTSRFCRAIEHVLLEGGTSARATRAVDDRDILVGTANLAPVGILAGVNAYNLGAGQVINLTLQIVVGHEREDDRRDLVVYKGAVGASGRLFLRGEDIGHANIDGASIRVFETRAAAVGRNGDLDIRIGGLERLGRALEERGERRGAVNGKFTRSPRNCGSSARTRRAGRQIGRADSTRGERRAGRAGWRAAGARGGRAARGKQDG